MKRIYVNVACNIINGGQEVPSVIYWPDGKRQWAIDEVLHVRKQSLTGREGYCYTVLIGGVEKQIYKNSTGWYVVPSA